MEWLDRPRACLQAPRRSPAAGVAPTKRTEFDPLRAHRDRQDFERKREGWEDRGLIFCTIYGGPLEQKRYDDHWPAACRPAGIERH